jgi:cell division protein FtsZ
METIRFNLPKEYASIIKVIGVGGGGSNAVNHMFRQGIKGVDFVVCNTDAQALDFSPIPAKVQLGSTLTEGRGAGSLPQVGKDAAVENIEDIKSLLGETTKMVFITAGMGGGTGTGAAPIVAQTAREMGILTVGIVTLPFSFEGKRRRQQAEEGIEEMRNAVDTLLVISNDKLREMYGNLSLSNAFAQADNVLTTAAKGIAEIITVTGYINVDFEDVRTVMNKGGSAIMGSASAEGENRASRAIESALSSPLLNDNIIKGAKHILLNITAGDIEATMDEVSEISDFVQEEAGMSANIIFGTGHDPELGDKINVTVIATGFNTAPLLPFENRNQPEKIVHVLKTENTGFNANATTTNTTTTTTTTKVEETPVTQSWDVSEPVAKTTVTPLTNDTLFNTPPPTEEKSTSIKTLDINFDDKIKTDKLVRTVYPQANELKKDLEPTMLGNTTPPATNDVDDANFNRARINRLREMSLKLKTSSGLNELENVPAYVRAGVELGNTPKSDESQVSRYTLEEGADKTAELKRNNPFLHDNVD